jgi:hypothetical protein
MKRNQFERERWGERRSGRSEVEAGGQVCVLDHQAPESHEGAHDLDIDRDGS